MNVTAPLKSEAVEKISVRDLKFFYGDNLALKGVNVALLANKVTAFIGPSGCGKSTLLRVFNRMYELYPNQRAEGASSAGRQEHSRRGRGPQSIAVARGNGVPETYAFSDDDL